MIPGIADPLAALLADLTDAQREAVTHVEGPLLVLAGPGSGKTRVITRRIAFLVENGIPPDNILAITFTNKAAGEMRSRVEALIPASGAHVSTFHSFCAGLLRRELEGDPVHKDFTIYDAEDAGRLVGEVLEELGIDPERTRPAQFASAISKAKGDLLTPETFEERAIGRDPERLGRIFRRYEERKAGNNALDFDDLLLTPLRLFEKRPELLARARDRWRFILVDEFQDTNQAQYRLACALGGGHRNLCVTGDPDQSIYGWRGARIGNILSFAKDFPGTLVVGLEENFRSVGNVLKAAAALVANNRERLDKTVWTRREDGPRIEVVEAMDTEQEADVVAGEIEAELAAREPGDFAVFYRTNAQSRLLETALRLRRIPYVIAGAVSFYQRREVKDVLAYLRAAVNPRDGLSFVRVVNVPPRGLGKAAQNAIRDLAARKGIGLLEAAARAGEAAGLGAKAREAAQEFAALLRSAGGGPLSPVKNVLQYVLDQSGYLAMLKEAGDADRIENVLELVNAASEFDAAYPDGDVRDFLQQTSLVSDTDALKAGNAAVSLMTLHAAKGLEFPVVFITGVEDGLLPLRPAENRPQDIEEERRLLYVGLTRAKERVVLSHALQRQRAGAWGGGRRSRFLDEIPPSLIEEKAAGPGGLLAGEGGEGGDLDFGLEEIERPGGRAAGAGERRYEPDEAAPAAGPDEPLRAGDLVRHPRFGAGRVVLVSGRGKELRARIRFAQGEKDILVAWARLARM